MAISVLCVTVIFLHGTLVSSAPLWMAAMKTCIKEMADEFVFGWKNTAASGLCCCFLFFLIHFLELHDVQGCSMMFQDEEFEYEMAKWFS